MNEGYWINYRGGKVIPIEEHERFVREPGNSRKLGIPDAVMRAAAKFKPVRDRDKFLLFLMQNAPVMRVRGHGSFVSFEYASHSRQEPMDAIWEFAKENAGPFTQLSIVNFATNESVQITFQQFEETMDTGGYDAIMRAASSVQIRRKIARELLALSKQLLA